MGSTVIKDTTVSANDLPATDDNDSVTLINSTATGTYSPGAGADSISLSGSSIGGLSSGDGDDTLVGSVSSIGGHIYLEDGNDHLSLDSVTMTENSRNIYTGSGDDQLSINAITGLSSGILGDGNDSLTISNSDLTDTGVFGAKSIDTGAGSDSVVLQNTSLPTYHSVFLGKSTAGDADTLVVTDSSLPTGRISSSGDGTYSVTIDNSTIGGTSNSTGTTGAMSLGNTGGGEVLVTNGSSVTGALNTGKGDDTINIDGGSTVSGLIRGGDGDNTINVTDGASANTIDLGTGDDSIHISDSTLTGQILDYESSTVYGSDTILIEDSTLIGAESPDVIRLAGLDNQVTIRNTDMGDNNIQFYVGNSTISIENTSLGKIDDVYSHEVSLAITGSTVDRGIVFNNGTYRDQTIDIRNSSIGLAGGTGYDFSIYTYNGNDQVSVIADSTLAVNNTNLGNGDDLFVLGTDTSLIAPNDSAGIIKGSYEISTGDTLRLYGNDPFSITLKSNLSATLNDNSTISVITNGNIEDIQSFPTQIDGTLSLAKTNTTVRLHDFEVLEAVECFVDGTLITTARGELPVERLQAGDMVRTADAGFQPIRWAGSRRVTRLDLLLNHDLIPVRIKQGALGNGMPLRDLLVSPQHRMLVSGKLVERIFGVGQALVAAKHLLAVDGIELATGMDSFAYVHLMFDDHQVIYAEGTPSESLFAGEMALQTLGDDACKELELIFPELAMPVSDFVMLPARYFVTGRQGRKLAERAVKNGISLLDNVKSTARVLVSG